MLTRFLESKGYRVLGAADGQQVVEVAARERPDLILMDLGLPGTDGLSVVTRSRERVTVFETPHPHRLRLRPAGVEDRGRRRRVQRLHHQALLNYPEPLRHQKCERTPNRRGYQTQPLKRWQVPKNRTELNFSAAARLAIPSIDEPQDERTLPLTCQHRRRARLYLSRRPSPATRRLSPPRHPQGAPTLPLQA